MSQEKVAEIIDLSASRKALEADKETAGDFLRAARSAAGLDIAGVSEEIKVKPAHLEAIEANEASRLPAIPYAVGFVKVYAQFLGLDADAVVRQFKRDIGAGEGAIGPALNEAEAREGRPDFSEGARLGSIFGVIAIVVFMIWAAIQVAGTAERTAVRSESAPERGVVVVDETAAAPQPRVALRDADTSPAVVVTEGALPMTPAARDTPRTDNATSAAALETAEDVQTSRAAPAAAPAPASAILEDPAPDESALSDVETTPAPAQTDAPPRPAPESAPARREAPPPAPVVVAARLKRSIAPRYPNACDRGAEALEKVDVIFDITAEGRPANARVVSSSNDCFNEAALDALKRWRFDPRTLDGAARPDLAKRATLNFRR